MQGNRLQKPHERKQRYSIDYTESFQRTAEFYIQGIHRLAGYPLSASTLGDDFAPRSLRPDLLAEWVCDAERAMNYALMEKEHLHPVALALLRHYGGMASEIDSFPLGERVDAIQRIGKIIEARKLEPGRYFRRVKKRRGE